MKVIKDKSVSEKIEEAEREAAGMIKQANETLERAKEKIRKAR